MVGFAFETVHLSSAYERLLEQRQRPQKKRKLGAQTMPQPPPSPSGASLATPNPEPLTGLADQARKTVDLYYYLLRPRTNGAQLVLIPVSASMTLSQCLRGKVVLEFPTFYVLSHPPNSLPEGFVTDDQLHGDAKEELESTTELVSSFVEPEKSETDERKTGNEADVQHIMELLK